MPVAATKLRADEQCGRVTLNKPLKRISEEMGLPFIHLTVHGMRRTFNSFALAADTNNLVTRSISGHLTEKMQEEYTTVWSPKQRQAIDTVIGLMGTPSLVSASPEMETDADADADALGCLRAFPQPAPHGRRRQRHHRGPRGGASNRRPRSRR